MKDKQEINTKIKSGKEGKKQTSKLKEQIRQELNKFNEELIWIASKEISVPGIELQFENSLFDHNCLHDSSAYDVFLRQPSYNKPQRMPYLLLKSTPNDEISLCIHGDVIVSA